MALSGIVDGDVHHRVHARFMEWVVEWGDAGRGGGLAGVLAPGEDGIAVGRQCDPGRRGRRSELSDGRCRSGLTRGELRPARDQECRGKNNCHPALAHGSLPPCGRCEPSVHRNGLPHVIITIAGVAHGTPPITYGPRAGSVGSFEVEVAFSSVRLGPLSGVIDGVDVTPHAEKERALLAMLVINHGRVVSADRLMEELWPDLTVVNWHGECSRFGSPRCARCSMPPTWSLLEELVVPGISSRRARGRRRASL